MAVTGYLPAPVEKLLSDLTVQNFPFVWSIQNDGITASLNLSWKIVDQKRHPLRSLQNKPPSTIKRDKERMTAFLQRKETRKMDSDTENTIPVKSTKTAQVSSVMTPKTCTNSPLSTQTEVLTSSVSVQTLKSVITSVDREVMCVMKPEMSECMTQTSVTMTSKQSQTDLVSVNSVETSLQHNDFGKHSKVLVKETESVRKSRVKNCHTEYLIKWRNQPANKNTWVPESKLDKVAVAYIEKHFHKITGPTALPPPTKHQFQCDPALYPSDRETLFGKVISDIVRVRTMHCDFDQISYTAELQSGQTKNVQKEEIPPHIFDRYMRIGY